MVLVLMIVRLVRLVPLVQRRQSAKIVIVLIIVSVTSLPDGWRSRVDPSNVSDPGPLLDTWTFLSRLVSCVGGLTSELRRGEVAGGAEDL